MKKNILLAVFGGITLFGLVLMLVGFLLGGRWTAVNIRNGQVVLREKDQWTDIVDLPYWLSYEDFFDRFDDSWDYDDGIIAPATTNTNPYTAAPFSQGDLRRLDIEVDAGYVIIKPGTEFGLTVDGPMEYSSVFLNGQWTVTSEFEGSKSVTVRNKHFYLNGKDITTTFTFTLPAAFDELTLDIGFGTATVDNITLKTLDCSAGMGYINISNSAATNSDINADMGSVTLTNFYGTTVDLDCSMGKINFDGAVLDLFTAECDMGTITANLARPSDYGWRAEVGVGTIAIDGHKMTTVSGNTTGGNQSARPFFDLSCDMGTIDITFSDHHPEPQH